MEFSFNLNNIFEKSICRIDNNFLIKNKYNQKFKQITMVINLMGEASSKAQKLPSIITTVDKIIISNHVYYLKFKNNIAIGFIKVGYKKLFFRDYHGKIKELEPISILDFYVSEKIQRSGHGKDLFENFLKDFNVKPHKIAIDRPSYLFINFLKKNYNLKNYIPQNNNFVIFDKFFDEKNDNKNIQKKNNKIGINFKYDSLEEKIRVKEKELELIKEKLNGKKNVYQNLPKISNRIYNPITHTVFNNKRVESENKLTRNNNFYSKTNLYGIYSNNKVYRNKNFFFK